MAKQSFLWRMVFQFLEFNKGIDPLTIFGIGSAVSGLAGIGSSAMNNAASAANTAATNQANRDIAKDTNNMNRAMMHENFGFQERMSNSAYQRATEDMRKAGINPMLAMNNGGASTPSGGAATAVTGAPTQTPEYSSPLGAGISSAMNTMSLMNQLKQTDADVAVKKAQQLVTLASVPSVRGKAKSANAEANAAIAQAQKDQATAGYDKKYAPWDALTSRFIQALGGAVDAVSIGRMIKGSRIQGQQNQRQQDNHELRMKRGVRP